MSTRPGIIIASLLAWTVAVLSAADDVAKPASVFGWRLDGSGDFPDARPPLEWSLTSGVVWQTKLPKSSNASPVIAGDAIVCCVEPWTLLCLDRASGEIRWQKTVSVEDATPPEELEAYRKARVEGQKIQRELWKARDPFMKAVGDAKARPDDAELKAQVAELRTKVREVEARLEPYLYAIESSIHPVCGWSVATPVTDGSRVWAVFANGVGACFDLKGERVWLRRIERPAPRDQFSSSPLLAGGKLIVQLGDLKALDPATGETIWTAAAPGAFGTPAVVALGQVPALLTPSGSLVRLGDGHVLAEKLASLRNVSPIVHDGVAYFIEGDAVALKLPDSDAEPVKPIRRWRTPKVYEAKIEEVFCASPVWHEGVLYAMSVMGQFVAIDAADGKVLYQHPFEADGPRPFLPSITSAGGHLFVCASKGRTVVLQPGRTYQEACSNDSAPIRGSPVFAGERMYLRTSDGLACIGPQAHTDEGRGAPERQVDRPPSSAGR